MLTRKWTKPYSLEIINCYETVSDITVQFKAIEKCSLVLRRGFLIRCAILVINKYHDTLYPPATFICHTSIIVPPLKICVSLSILNIVCRIVWINVEKSSNAQRFWLMLNIFLQYVEKLLKLVFLNSLDLMLNTRILSLKGWECWRVHINCWIVLNHHWNF